MFKKILLVTAIAAVLAVFFTGCSEKKVTLNYIKTPDGIILNGYENKDELDELNSKLKELKTENAGREEQQKVLDEIADLTSKSSLNIKDKDFIDKVFAKIQNSEGIEGPSAKMPDSEAVFGMQLSYDNIKKTSTKKIGDTVVTEVIENTAEDSSQGYIPSLTIFSDGTVLIPLYDKDAPSKAVIAKIILDQEIIKYIAYYYNSNK